MSTSDFSAEALLARCLSQLRAAEPTSWSKEGQLLVEKEVQKAAASMKSSLLATAFDLIALIGQLARSSTNAAKDGPAEALDRATRNLTDPLDKPGVGLTRHTQGLLEETVTALVQVVGLLKTPSDTQSLVEPAASFVASLEKLRRQLLAEPAFRMPGSLVARSRAFLVGSTEQRSAKHNPLPSATPAFRGRDALLTQMQDSLDGTPAPGRHALVVRGRRGMGKTQLVLAYVIRNLAQYDKVLWLAAGTPAWRVRYLQLGAYVGVDLIAQASWEQRAAQVRAGIGAYDGRTLLVIDGADEKLDIGALVPERKESGTMHLIVATSTPLLQLEKAVELEVPELSDSHAMALLRGSDITGSAASEANLAAAAASFKDLTLTLAVAACLFLEGAAVPSVLLDHADPLGLQTSRRRSEGAGQFWLGRCCYEALRFLEDSGKEKALLASTSALVGGWFGPGGISLDLLVSGLQWHIGSRVNATKVEAALVELGQLGIATRQEDGSIVFPSVLRNYVAADKKRGGHHAMLRALASTTCDWGNSDHFRAVWLRRAELADSYPRKQLVLLIGLKTVQFFVAGSGEYDAAESLCTQALAWLGKEEPTWRAEFAKHQAQALAAQRKYAAAAHIWQAQTRSGEPLDAEEAFMPRNFRLGLSPLPLDLSHSRESSVNGDPIPTKLDTPDSSLDCFHAALPNLRITPAPETNGKAHNSETTETPTSNLSTISGFGITRKRLSRAGSLAKADRSFARPVSPSTFANTLRRSTSTPPQRPTPPKTPRPMSPHLTRMTTLKNGSPEVTAEVLRQENDTLVRASPLPARPASAYQNRRKSWSPSLRTSQENEEREVVAARVPEALLGQAAVTACEGDLEIALRLLHQAREHPAAEEGGHVPEVLGRQGLVQLAVGENSAGMESLRNAADAVLEKSDVSRCQYVLAHADALAEAGRAKEAAERYRSAGDLLAKDLGASSLFVLDIRQRQAAAEVAVGAVAEGVALLEEVRTAHQTTLLPTSPARVAGLQALAEAYAEQGRNDEALGCWEEAAVMQSVALPQQSPSLARSLLVRAALYQAKLRKKEVAENVKRALAIEESVQPTGSRHLARSLAQAANVLRAQKRFDEALPLAQRSVEAHGSTSWGNPLEEAASLEALASVQMGRKRFDEAQSLFTKALSIHEQTGTTANKATAEVLTNLAEVAELQGRKEKAHPLLERAVDIYDKLGVQEDDPAFVRAKKKMAGFRWQRQVSGFCCAPKTR